MNGLVSRQLSHNFPATQAVVKEKKRKKKDKVPAIINLDRGQQQTSFMNFPSVAHVILMQIRQFLTALLVNTFTVPG